jgi:hypothetical protein
MNKQQQNLEKMIALTLIDRLCVGIAGGRGHSE